MARKRVTFLPKIPTFLKYLLLSISLTMFLLLSHAQLGSAGLSLQHQAQKLTDKGHEQLHQGRATEALKTWQEATRLYQQLNNQEGVIGSSINESLALQALGLYPRACDTLSQALKLKDWVCASPIQLQQSTPDKSQQVLTTTLHEQPKLSVRAIGLRNLGDVLRLIGKPDESEIVLQQALAMANQLFSGPDTNDILLSLANTERTLYNRARNTYQTTEEPVAKKKGGKSNAKQVQSCS